MADDNGDDIPVQYLIHAALRPRLDMWLASRGFRVDRLPPDVEGPDSLPTYLVAPDDEAIEAALGARASE